MIIKLFTFIIISFTDASDHFTLQKKLTHVTSSHFKHENPYTFITTFSSRNPSLFRSPRHYQSTHTSCAEQRDAPYSLSDTPLNVLSITTTTTFLSRPRTSSQSVTVTSSLTASAVSRMSPSLSLAALLLTTRTGMSHSRKPRTRPMAGEMRWPSSIKSSRGSKHRTRTSR